MSTDSKSRELRIAITLPDGETVTAGTLAELPARMTAERLTFEYDAAYLAHPKALPISPDLDLRRGQQYPPVHLEMFSGLSDAMPDTWGRRVAAAEARIQGNPPWNLTPFDYFSLVPESTRQGELSVIDGSSVEVPGLERIQDLADTVEQFNNGDDITAPEMLRLLPLGTSQGGAQPKMAVRLADGSLAMAKFPNRTDRWDVGRWEAVETELATRAGLPTAPFVVVPFDQHSSVFVTKRFDRDTDRKIGYWSGQTLMQKSDTQGVPYTDLAAFVMFVAANRRREGERIFRQAAFSVLTGNVDDHFRNFGVLRQGDGSWASAPAFDMNPFAWPAQVQASPLSPDDDPHDRRIEHLITAIDAFELTHDRALEILHEVEVATRDWSDAAQANGLDGEAIQKMAGAFESPQRDFVRGLPGPEINRSAGPVPFGRSSSRTRSEPGGGTGTEWVSGYTNKRGTPVAGYWRKRRRS